MTKLVRDASSVILMALRTKPYRTPYNYNVLTLKRSENSSFMPNAIVFPGGTVEEIDASPKWLDLFKNLGVPSWKLESFTSESNLPDLFQAKKKSALSKQISLRITAIRETFEETGVLLCKSVEHINGKNNTFASCIESVHLAEWRKRVEADPSFFLSLCTDLSCVPDIWALKLWSNWITPETISKRFNTAFFTACLPEKPTSSKDNTEVSELEWIPPDNLALLNKNKKIWLPPPQIYEVSRLLLFFMLEDLALFAEEREKLGCEAFEPTLLNTNDGTISSLPGDDLYGDDDLSQYSACSLREVREAATHLHRMEIHEKGVELHMFNYSPKFGHVLPFTSNTKC